MNRNYEEENKLIEKLNGPTAVKDEVLNLKLSNPTSFGNFLDRDCDLNESSLLIMKYMDKEIFSKMPPEKVTQFFHDFMYMADAEYNKAYKEALEIKEKYTRIVKELTNNLPD
jgi:hypothetical protein